MRTVYIYLRTDDSTSLQYLSSAVVVPARAITISFMTDHSTTATALELAALRAALCLINREPPRQWSIFCDSKAGLQPVLSALRRRPYELLVFDMRSLLHSSHKKGHHVMLESLRCHREITHR
uniref:Tick transposon n=1 Tax=Rhipicephalus appendiculatus TaxID=34631 RepID=A0A131YU19_RHIAP